MPFPFSGFLPLTWLNPPDPLYYFSRYNHYFVIFFDFSDDLGIQRHFWFKKNQFYVIILTSVLEKGNQYKIKMNFRAMLGDGLAGLYKSIYKRKDGTEV